jgi:hypothetical protein
MTGRALSPVLHQFLHPLLQSAIEMLSPATSNRLLIAADSANAGQLPLALAVLNVSECAHALASLASEVCVCVFMCRASV